MRRLAAVLLLGATLALLPATAAAAHPLGNFTVNTADQVVVVADGVEVLHVVDLAEIPTVQARAKVTAAGGLPRYAETECARVAPLLQLQVDGRPAALQLQTSTGEPRAGQAGLTTTRIECRLRTRERPRSSIAFTDAAVDARVGWKEVTLETRCGELRGADVPAASPSRLLTEYPEDLLSSPLDVTSARADLRDGDCAAADTSATDVADEALPRGAGGISAFFTDFLGRKDLTAGFAVVSVLAALAFGILHALAPGHGKTVMAAYLVGQRGTRRQAVQLGAVVTFTHTASVLLLGALLALGTLAAPERAVPFTEVLSGLLLIGVGVYLLVLAVRRVRGRAGSRHPHERDRTGDDHEHPHDHDHPHDHKHEHEHEHEHEHAHDHDHEHPHDHDHPHDHEHEHDHDHAHDHAHDHDHEHGRHAHGGRVHSHAPLPSGRLGWKSLVGMGVAGGLVPSPSALIVLLGATALGRAWFGVVLVVVYGLGMAVTLTAAGLLLLRAQAVLDRRGWRLGRARNLGRLLPVATAAVVVLVGSGLLVRGVVTGRDLL